MITNITPREQELLAINKELLEALEGLHDEMLYVLRSINADKIHHVGDEFHERLGAATGAIERAVRGEST